MWRYGGEFRFGQYNYTTLITKLIRRKNAESQLNWIINNNICNTARGWIDHRLVPTPIRNSAHKKYKTTLGEIRFLKGNLMDLMQCEALHYVAKVRASFEVNLEGRHVTSNSSHHTENQRMLWRVLPSGRVNVMCLRRYRFSTPSLKKKIAISKNLFGPELLHSNNNECSQHSNIS